MDENRKVWNRRQKELRKLLEQKPPPAEAFRTFFAQHAALHSAKLGGEALWSFQDEILDDLNEAGYRVIPMGQEHSIAWLLWHIARVEDLTMTMLVAGQRQLFVSENWHNRLGIGYAHTGNAMSAEEIYELSETIRIPDLQEYRLAVGKQTVEIVRSTTPERLPQIVDPDRIQQVTESCAVHPDASAIIDYWSKRTISGLLLMPATRHNFIHLNEAERIKTSLDI